ncbi:iron sulfur cluster assembly protein 1 [Microsporum canis CBS 113480]|uniref:Iron sulfur cluster assembly protein 1 n=1 Tax=Arthroderma otae (strain ATCC MYA-4605 / CBS 113480) TaxID=554155 RepID=C5FFA0_ARTOC|nr:iron sulfur cluster assembly protein 1 [Microsporum canis CBS 113480]EEQ28484.1 iron sulfur cluster assembly protein 1 [Microsporum canis CBS 113480]
MFRRAVSLAPRATRCIASPAISRPALTPLTPVPAVTLRMTRSYHEKDMQSPLYFNPRNVGSMSKTDMDVGTGLVGAPACGDVMKLQIRVDKSNNTISDVKFKTFGCGSAIASSSYLTELVRGMTLEEAAKIRNTEIAKELCLPPVKQDAIKSAINNYYSKNPTTTDLSGTGASIAEVAAQPAQPATPAPASSN